MDERFRLRGYIKELHVSMCVGVRVHVYVYAHVSALVCLGVYHIHANSEGPYPDWLVAMHAEHL